VSALPPGPTMPRLLQDVGWIARPLPWLERCRARYGDVFTLNIAQEGAWVMLSHPDHVKQVFTGDPDVFHAGEANVVLRPVLGPHSVLLLDGAEHMAQRRLMLPSFHGERMQRYESLMTAVAEQEVSQWPAGEPFTLLTRMQSVTLEVIMRAVFGFREPDRLAELRGRLRRMLDSTTQMRHMVMMAVLGPERVESAGLFRRAVEPVDEMLIEESRRRRAADDLDERDDVLSLLVQASHEDGRPMSDAELRDELITLLLAGHETTATSLSWAIERLVRHPEKWERLREEALSGEDTYADAVAKETLRLRPVLPIVVRRLSQPVEIGGWQLPAGAQVTPCIHLVHRRPDVYPEPHSFRPERFLEQPAGTYTWIPFGGGVRRCLGATFALFEMKTVLKVIAREAALRPARQEPERVARRVITLIPGRGTEVVMAPRHSHAPVEPAAPAKAVA
jgi:cytochrome P450 family 135